MLRQFVVSRHKDDWWVTSVGRCERCFASREEALQAAEDMARDAFAHGDDSQVLMMGGRGAPRRWSAFGCHPEAPYHLH